MRWLRVGGLAAGLVLTSAGGYLASEAFSAGTAQEPVTTVTVSIGTGEQGPAGPPGATGPAGPQGPPGSVSDCPAGSVFGKLVLNHPGGQVAIYTCIVG